MTFRDLLNEKTNKLLTVIIDWSKLDNDYKEYLFDNIIIDLEENVDLKFKHTDRNHAEVKFYESEKQNFEKFMKAEYFKHEYFKKLKIEIMV